VTRVLNTGECLSGASTGATSSSWPARAGSPIAPGRRPGAGDHRSRLSGAHRPCAFFSATHRLFRHFDGLEEACGKTTARRDLPGRIRRATSRLSFDKQPPNRGGRVFAVCGNTLPILAESRHAPHFQFRSGSLFDRHLRPFPGLRWRPCLLTLPGLQALLLPCGPHFRICSLLLRRSPIWLSLLIQGPVVSRGR